MLNLFVSILLANFETEPDDETEIQTLDEVAANKLLAFTKGIQDHVKEIPVTDISTAAIGFGTYIHTYIYIYC